MSRPETCSRCGEEVRWGWRHGRQAYWHRLDVDHLPLFGTIITPEMRAEHDRLADVVRSRVNEKTGETEWYTSRTYHTHGVSKTPDLRWLREDEEGEDAVGTLPEPEQRATPVEVTDLPARSGMRQIANLVVKTPGWELRRLTKARGPYLGAAGKMLGISDSLVLGAVGPRGVDESRPGAVASWRDGAYDSGYIGYIAEGVFATDPANSTELKDWIKREH